MGRPKKPTDEKANITAVRLSNKDKEMLDILAVRFDKKSRGEVIRELIDKAYKQEKKAR